MRFQMLGGLAVFDGERAVDLPARKQRAVLAVLLLERDRVVATDRLIDMLWADDADKALGALQVYISRLRSILEPNRRPRDPATVLVSQPPGYRLAVARDQVDLFHFEDEVARGRAELANGEIVAAGATLDAALRMWCGELLPEFSTEPFVLASAGRVTGIRAAAVEAVGQVRLELGDHIAAIDVLEREAAESPIRERLHGLLALGLYRAERQADALRVIDRCRRALIESAGLDIGPELKRLESGVLAQSPELVWRPRPASGEPAGAVPKASHPPVIRAVEPAEAVGPDRSRPVIVGRKHELGVLERAVIDADNGRGGVTVLLGEPGIGKTRLAESTIDFARSRGMATAWCRCPGSRTAPPFWAVVDLGDQLRAAGIDHAVSGDPGVRIRLRKVIESDDGRVGRFDLYRAMLASLSSINRPAVLVIDDLQWADPDTLRLLEHIVGELSSTRVLLVVTMRPLTEDSPPGLVDCLAEVARSAGGVTLRLAGLQATDVAGWLADQGDADVVGKVAALIHERTGGNPLFVREVTEMLAAEGRLMDPAAVRAARVIPPGVQFVVRRRVSRLPRQSQELLSVAAVLGPTFDIESLAAAAGLDVAAVLDDLGPAFDAGLVIETGPQFGFSHALVADALADEVNALRKAAIHAAAARSLFSRSGNEFGSVTAAIAHHALAGILAGTGDLAIEASRHAAGRSASRLAYEDAAAHWANVAAAVARSRPSDRQSQVDALIEQARCLTHMSMTTAAKVPALAAIELAEAAGLPDRAVRAAGLLNCVHVRNDDRYGEVDERAVGALQRVVTTAAPTDSIAYAELLGALAAELVFADADRRGEACSRAERAARACGDPLVLAKLLGNLWLPGRPDQHDLLHRASLELVDLVATAALPHEYAVLAHQQLAECALQIGDFERAAAELTTAHRRVDRSIPPRLWNMRRWCNAAVAVATGRYDAAQRLIEEAHAAHRHEGLVDANFMRVSGRSAMALDRGGLEAFVPIVARRLDHRTAPLSPGRQEPLGGYGRSVVEAMAFLMTEIGRTDLATALVSHEAMSSPFRDDFTLLFGATAAVHVRVELGDFDGSAAAAELLARYPDRWASAGASPMSLGPVCLAIARFEAMRGHHDAAAQHFDAAARLCRRGGAAAWLARTQVHYASFLGQRGDRAGATYALAEAADLAVRYELPYVRHRIDQVEGSALS